MKKGIICSKESAQAVPAGLQGLQAKSTHEPRTSWQSTHRPSPPVDGIVGENKPKMENGRDEEEDCGWEGAEEGQPSAFVIATLAAGTLD